MFANSLRPTGREYRMTPCTFEQGAGRLPRPPKSPLLATRTQRCASTWSVRVDGAAIYRDVLTKGIPMNTPPNETPRHEARGVARACENTDAGNNTSPASKLIAEADAIAASIPFMMTRERKHSTASSLLKLWLRALAVSRGEEQAA